jgi:hypothetical protein
LLERWISEGARYQNHWAFRNAGADQPEPDVKQR